MDHQLKKLKRQKFKEGAFIEIKLSENKKLFGRLLPSFHICVYDYLVATDIKFIMEKVIHKPILFYVGVYKAIITNGCFEIVGFKDLIKEELEKIPPEFTQSEPHIEKCSLIHFDGQVEKVSPFACIGLEKASAYSDLNLIERIKDFYSGKKKYFR